MLSSATKIRNLDLLIEQVLGCNPEIFEYSLDKISIMYFHEYVIFDLFLLMKTTTLNLK